MKKITSITVLFMMPLFVDASGVSVKVIEKIQRKIDQLRVSQKLPGLSVSTFTTTGTQLSLSSGTKKNGMKLYIDPTKTLFPVSSVSKIFTTLAAFNLVAERKLDLESSLSSFKDTPFYKVTSQRCPRNLSELSRIKVKHLLNHQAGISQDAPNSSLWWDSQALSDNALPTKRDFINGFCKTDFIFTPGEISTGMKYSNLGFNLLAQVIESLAKTTFEEYVRKTIIRPLGMRNTFYQIPRQSRRDLSFTHGLIGSLFNSSKEERTLLPKVFYPNSYSGSIGISISSSDLAKLGAEMLSWTSERPSKLKKIKSMWNTILNPQSKNSRRVSWSNGLMIFDTKSDDFSGHKDGFLCYGHTGTNYGSRGILYICPELEWGFAAGFNTRNANRELFMKEVSQILMDSNIIGKKRMNDQMVADWLQFARSFQEDLPSFPVAKRPEEGELSLAPDHLKPFLGAYHSDTTGPQKVSITKSGNLLFWGNELIQEGENIFRFPPNIDPYTSGEPVVFIRDSSGRVTHMKAAHVLWAQKIKDI